MLDNNENENETFEGENEVKEFTEALKLDEEIK